MKIAFHGQVALNFNYGSNGIDLPLTMNESLTAAKSASRTFRNDYKPAGISVVIPSYNSKNLFTRTLDPLFSALNETTLSYEVIVVDDCSNDDSIAFIKQRFPQVKVLENETNSGFSLTINKGIFASRYELLFLLNSDIIVTPGYFDHQLKYFTDRTTFGVMGRIVGWDDDIIQDAARFPQHHGMKIKTSCNYLLDNMGEEWLYTLYLSGANALVSRDKVRELGGFDEIFSPFYIEDCDLSFRAWRLGWKCYYDHQSICRHKTSSTIKAKDRKQYIEKVYNRNKLFLHAIHLEGHLLPLYLLQSTMEAIANLFLLKLTLLKSLVLFIIQRRDWLNSRNRMKGLLRKYKTSYSLGDITDLIKTSVQQRKIIKFRSGQLN